VTITDPSARVALVTGCGKALGIGSATARELARAGHTVVVSDVEPEGIANDLDTASDRSASWKGLASLVEEIQSHSGVASSIVGDVCVETDAQRMVTEVLARYGRLDILVNNAGAPHGDDRGDIEDVTLAAWERVMAVNVRGVFLMSRAAVGAMRARRWGRIVNIASAIVRHAIPRRTAYTTSKAAVVGFTQSLALEMERGDVNLSPHNLPLSKIDVRCRNVGNIDLTLPGQAKFELSASTDRGEVRNEYGTPVIRVEGDGRSSRLKTSAEGGPSIQVSTARGTITVRKE